MTHTKRTTCHVCGGDRLTRFLSLGPMPLANAFLNSPEEFAQERSYPLDVYFCERCSLVQLLDVIDPAIMFQQYVYLTGISDTVAKHNLEYAQEIVDLLSLGEEDLVVEVASNDGSLLKCFKPYGVTTLGVEPAKNVAEIARSNGIDTLTNFFDSAIAKRVRTSYGPARAVIGNNVLAHVEETRDFLRGFRDLVDDTGLVVIEVPYLGDMLDQLYYNSVYHEHQCYFSVTTLLRLCDAVGLACVRMDHLLIHGGSLRMYAGRKEHYGTHAEKVLQMADDERRIGLMDLARYEHFAAEVEDNRHAILNLLQDLQGGGKTVAGYGAPANGNVLLNYCSIGTDLVPFTVDKNDLKIGLYTPGMHLPVLPVSALLEQKPDYLLILAWNFAREIIEQQRAYYEQGGRFIIPIPQPTIV